MGVVSMKSLATAAVVAVFALASPAAAIEDECKACRAIGKEVAAKIIKDAPWKKHKKRADSDPLVMSEYEMVSTMESSCNKLKGYNYKRGVREYDDKQISSYCLKVMEDRDEQLTDLIQSKSLTTANVRQNVINTMCSWETKKKSPCKTEDELLVSATLLVGKFVKAAEKAAEIEGDVPEKKEEETTKEEEKKEEAGEKKEKKAKKAPSSKKSKKSSKKSEL